MKTSTFMRLRARSKSAGVAIVTAIFLLVVVAGLAVAVVSLTTAQQDASAKDLQGQRAYLAAKAGVEWALMRGLQSGLTPPQPAVTFGCTATQQPAPLPVALPQNTTLSAFTVTVTITCDAGVAGVAGGGANDPTAHHVVISSTACNQPANGVCPNAAPGPDYVQRVITAQL
jgi:MSHA biogenesis protein MshP